MREQRTSVSVLMAHIHAAYQQLQASLTTLAHDTRNQEYRNDVGNAQRDLDKWRIQHWRNITDPSRRKEK